MRFISILLGRQASSLSDWLRRIVSESESIRVSQSSRMRVGIESKAQSEVNKRNSVDKGNQDQAEKQNKNSFQCSWKKVAHFSDKS